MLSFGGTKNGLMGAEAVLFFDKSLLPAASFYRKQAMQLGSKMRYVAVQFEALISEDLWRRNARHANAMASRLADSVSGTPDVQLVMPVETNAVFARLPSRRIAALQAQITFVTKAGEILQFIDRIYRPPLSALGDCDGPRLRAVHHVGVREQWLDEFRVELALSCRRR